MSDWRLHKHLPVKCSLHMFNWKIEQPESRMFRWTFRPKLTSAYIRPAIHLLTAFTRRAEMGPTLPKRRGNRPPRPIVRARYALHSHHRYLATTEQFSIVPKELFRDIIGGMVFVWRLWSLPNNRVSNLLVSSRKVFFFFCIFIYLFIYTMKIHE
jgi:hypothetical protein